MQICLDPADKTPPFEQIKAEIIRLIAAGALPVQHRLPSIRQLAGDLGVAPNTVARAYRELEADGFVRSRGRRGTTVARTATPSTQPSGAIDDAVTDARRRGLDGPAILALVARSLAKESTRPEPPRSRTGSASVTGG